MAHQPSVILLVKNKKSEAKALRVELRMATKVLKALIKEHVVMGRGIAKQAKAIEQLRARIEEVKHVPTKRQVLAVAAPGSLGPGTSAAQPPF